MQKSLKRLAISFIITTLVVSIAVISLVKLGVSLWQLSFFLLVTISLSLLKLVRKKGLNPILYIFIYSLLINILISGEGVDMVPFGDMPYLMKVLFVERLIASFVTLCGVEGLFSLFRHYDYRRALKEN